MSEREHGSKPGVGGLATTGAEYVDRRERLRRLALETVDLSKDPYFFRNHIGLYECKLCLTLHLNEGSYLAHTQGKKHQTNLKKRAYMQAKDSNQGIVPKNKPKQKQKNIPKMGTPGYQVIKQIEPVTNQYSLLFQIEYPQIEKATKPYYRFMSPFEQKVETPDKKFQYLLFGAIRYETIAFKIPNIPIDRREGRLASFWDSDKKMYTLQVFFLNSLPQNNDQHLEFKNEEISNSITNERKRKLD